MSDVKTKKAVVVSDGLTYKAPGQEDLPRAAFGFQPTYVTLPATRGQEIELDKAEYDRFMALGAIAEPGSKEAGAAQSQDLRWGDPYGAVRISGEDGNLPVDKLRQEAKRLGVYQDPFGEDDADEGVSGAAPDDIDLSDRKAVESLNVAQLKQLAGKHGVTIESGDKKDDIVKKLVSHSS
jgi:hypothetical protein